jgi:hypothetical protein
VQKKVDWFEVYIQLKEKTCEEVLKSEIIGHLRSVLSFSDDITIVVKVVDDMQIDKSGKLMAVITEVKI